MGQKGAALGAVRGEPGVQRPVFLGLEGRNLMLPVADHPGGYGLDPSSGQAAADFLPQQRRELVAHNPVQNPPGLLGVHQVLVDGPGGRDGLVDHLFGDLVEGHTVGLVVRDVQQLLQMPGDGLSLPVRVGGQVDLARPLGRLLQVADDVLLALDGLVVRDEAALDVYAQLALGQVPHMAHGRLDLVSRTQVFADGLGLGRGLYYD